VNMIEPSMCSSDATFLLNCFDHLLLLLFLMVVMMVVVVVMIVVLGS